MKMRHISNGWQALYLGEKAEHLLHTHYHKRECYKFAGSCNA